MAQWVQHKSGQGQKWEVVGTHPHNYEVLATHTAGCSHWLPKSEYVLCDPPERWENITDNCEYINPLDGVARLVHDEKPVLAKECRIRKVPVTQVQGSHFAFIIEKKES